MNLALKLLLSTSVVCSLLSSPGFALHEDEEFPNPSKFLTLLLSQPKMPQQVPLILSYQDLEKQASIRHPSDFRRLSPSYEHAIRNLRQAHAHYTGKVYSAFFGLYNPSFVPVAKEMEKFLRAYSSKNPTHIFTKRLIRNMQNHIEDQDLTPDFLLALPFQFAASISTVTEHEKDFAAHAPYSQILSDSLENEAWKNNSSMALILTDSNDEFESFLPSSVVATIQDKMTRLLPFSFTLPFLGEGHFGPSFLVRTSLNHIFPAGFPLNRLRAHGIEVSSLGFGIHDDIHGKVDPRYRNLILHAIRRGEAHSIRGGNMHAFMDVYPRAAVRKYGVLMGALKEIYEHLANKIFLYHGVEAFRKATVGFFWTMHEEPHFPAKLYDMNDLDEVLKVITSSVKSEDEVLSDPLQTSPFTGLSAMTDTQIVDWVIQNKSVNDAQYYTIAKRPYKDDDLSFYTSINKDEIVSTKVNRTPQFIDILLALKTGKTLKYVFPTLYYQWNEMGDNLELLRFGGTHIQKPDLRDVNDPRTTAIETLKKVAKAISDHVDHFRKVAHFFAAYDPQGDGDNLGERYFKWHFIKEQGLQKMLPTPSNP